MARHTPHTAGLAVAPWCFVQNTTVTATPATPANTPAAVTVLHYRRAHPGGGPLGRCSDGIPGVHGIVVFDLGMFVGGVAPATITLPFAMATPAPRQAVARVTSAVVAAGTQAVAQATGTPVATPATVATAAPAIVAALPAATALTTPAQVAAQAPRLRKGK